MSILTKYTNQYSHNVVGGYTVDIESYLFASLESAIDEYKRGGNTVIQIQQQTELLAKISNEHNLGQDVIELATMANTASLSSIGIHDTYIGRTLISNTQRAAYTQVSTEGVFDVIDKIKEAFDGLLKKILNIRHDIVKWISQRISILTGKYSEAYDYLKSISDIDFKDKTERFFKDSKNVEEYGNYILGHGVVDQKDLDKQLTFAQIFNTMGSKNMVLTLLYKLLLNIGPKSTAKQIRADWAASLIKELGELKFGRFTYTVEFKDDAFEINENISKDTSIGTTRKALMDAVNVGLLQRFNNWVGKPLSGLIKSLNEAYAGFYNEFAEATGVLNGIRIDALFLEIYNVIIDLWRKAVKTVQKNIDFTLALKRF